MSAFTYQIRDDRIAPRRQDAEFSIGLILRLIRSYAGSRAEPLEVHLEHGHAASRRQYELAYGCPVFFRQTRNAVLLSTSDLGIASPVLSDKLYEILEAQLRDSLSYKHDALSFGDRIASALTPTSIQQKVSASRIARELCISESTLYRRLQAEDKSFQQLIDARREAVAKRLLASSSMTVAEVAAAVGYAENASFTRAFRRWTSTSPVQYRRERRASGLNR